VKDKKTIPKNSHKKEMNSKEFELFNFSFRSLNQKIKKEKLKINSKGILVKSLSEVPSLRKFFINSNIVSGFPAGDLNELAMI